MLTYSLLISNWQVILNKWWNNFKIKTLRAIKTENIRKQKVWNFLNSQLILVIYVYQNSHIYTFANPRKKKKWWSKNGMNDSFNGNFHKFFLIFYRSFNEKRSEWRWVHVAISFSGRAERLIIGRNEGIEALRKWLWNKLIQFYASRNKLEFFFLSMYYRYILVVLLMSQYAKQFIEDIQYKQMLVLNSERLKFILLIFVLKNLLNFQGEKVQEAWRIFFF